MQIPKEHLDELEAQAYSEALARYFEAIERYGISPAKFMEDYRSDLDRQTDKPGYAVHAIGGIRYYAKEDGTRWRERSQPEELRVTSYLSVVRDVTTKLAAEYLRNLKEWLERDPESGDIEEIRTRVTTSSALLLRQVEDMIEQLKPPRRYLRGSFYPIGLETIIDFEQTSERSRWDQWNLFPDSMWNHYTGLTEEGHRIYTTHTPYSGMQLEDVLIFLNSQEAVHMHIGETVYKDNKPVATIHTDGTIDLHEE